MSIEIINNLILLYILVIGFLIKAAGIIPLEKIPTKQEAQEIIRALAKTDKISWTLHSKQRMLEREINISSIKNCLEKGTIIEEPYRIYGNGGGYSLRLKNALQEDF